MNELNELKDTPLHTVYIPVPDKISNRIHNIYSYLSDKYENKYPLKNNWKAHINIFTQRVKEKDSQAYLSTLSQFGNIMPKIEITLDNFSLSNDHRYLFINLSQETITSILELRATIEQKAKEFRDTAIPQYYKEKWNTLSKSQRQSIKETGGLHKYSPHISITKLNEQEATTALKDIEQMDLNGLKWTAQYLEVSRQTDNPDNIFPVVSKINLI